jgi:hypothetical protein
MALAHCILGKFLGVGCHCFPPPLDVPTFSARCLHVQRREWPLATEGGTLRWREMFRQISSRIWLPRNSRDLLQCHKSATWDRRLYFSSEGRRAKDIYTLKNPTASAEFEPANWAPKASTLPLEYRSLQGKKYGLMPAIQKKKKSFPIRLINQNWPPATFSLSVGYNSNEERQNFKTMQR